jgi:hypothetical protein
VDASIFWLFDGDRIRADLGWLIFEVRLGVRRLFELAIASRSVSVVAGAATIMQPNEPADVRLEMTSWLKGMSHHDEKISFLAAVAIGMYSATGGRKPLSRPPHRHEAAAHLSL